MGFLGYRRPDGKVGVRNYVAVISTVVCANSVVNAISRQAPDVKPIMHTEGCGRGPADVQMTTRTLVGLGSNPNVAAVLLVSLGCEVIKPDFLVPGLSSSGKPLEVLSIQQEGGSVKAAAKGVEICKRLLAEAAKQERIEADWSELILGLECGGSDAMSGVTANPTVGRAVDWLVERGGSAILSETTEMIGTEEVLARRAVDPVVAERLKKLIKGKWQEAQDVLGPMAHLVISPGNMDGGLSTIQEKSLGCVIKGGTSTIQEVLDYSEAPTRKGLSLMDTPGSDIFSLTGMAAGGAQVIVFTTGRGTPAGFPLAPVIKVASNNETFENMRDDMDLNAGEIIEGASIEAVDGKLIETIQRVCNGEPSKAEANGNDLLAIHTLGPSF